MSTHPWSRHYPPGTRTEIDTLPHRHLAEMVREVSARYGDAVAFTQCMPNGMNGRLRFSQVDRLSDAFAAYLREEAGLRAGDRVAVQMPNCLAYPVVVFGVAKAGCVLVNTNPLYTPAEMTHQFADSGARALVIVDMFADRLPEVLPRTRLETVVTVRVSEFFPPLVASIIRGVQRYWNRQLPEIAFPHTGFQAALAQGAAALGRGADTAGYVSEVGPDTLAALQYTGGTTGVSKGAMLSHGNLLANMEQMLEMVRSAVRPGKETILTALPLYHVFAFTVNLLAFYRMGAHNVLVPSPRPPSNLKRAFENYPITWLSGVNTLFNALLNEPWFAEYPPRELRASVAGGMALHGSVAERWRAVTGTPVVEGYGLTEASPVLTFNPLEGRMRDGSIGIPMPSTEVRCVDDEGRPVPAGTPGEIVARGPQVMGGYWGRTDETAGVLRDGWLHTGDVGVMDEDGSFRIVDRKKDMILVNGFNVYPNEVEEALAAHPGVREVAVVGVPDARSGEAVRAFVVRGDPALDAEAVRRHARERLTAYKVPAQVEFRDELPKSPIGKILRKELRLPAPSAPVAVATDKMTVTGMEVAR